MAYRYCGDCGCAINSPPTIQEDLRDGQYCPDCGDRQPMDRSPTAWLIQLWEEVESLRLSNSLVVSGVNAARGDISSSAGGHGVGVGSFPAAGTATGTGDAIANGAIV